MRVQTRTFTLILAGVALFALVVGLVFFGPYRLAGHAIHVDLLSGDIKTERYFLGVTYKRQIDRMDLHRDEDASDPKERKWVIDSSFKPWVRHSPHYKWHGLALLMDRISQLSSELSESDREQLYGDTLTALQNERPSAVEEVVNSYTSELSVPQRQRQGSVEHD